ncbi:MAG: MotA/TolQ/ExbB proton channel family protein [Candidatus Omnitrophica bacterium]|nr:MotA/TolQ/ExbB proton channel family protein [Candidatus Omnitrophota bacterium]
MMNLWQLTIHGGIIMIPIIFCGLLAISIIIERIISLHQSEINSEYFLEKVEKTLKSEKIKEVVNLCDTSPGVTPAIIKAGILKSDRSIDEVKEAIKEEAEYQVLSLEKYLGILATIATIAPLLGFLGTSAGFIKTFMIIDTKGAAVTMHDLSKGMWEALLTTVAGLSVAIPSYIGYNYLVNWVHKIIAEMERASSKIIDVLIFLRANEETEKL